MQPHYICQLSLQLCVIMWLWSLQWNVNISDVFYFQAWLIKISHTFSLPFFFFFLNYLQLTGMSILGATLGVACWEWQSGHQLRFVSDHKVVSSPADLRTYLDLSLYGRNTCLWCSATMVVPARKTDVCKSSETPTGDFQKLLVGGRDGVFYRHPKTSMNI